MKVPTKPWAWQKKTKLVKEKPAVLNKKAKPDYDPVEEAMFIRILQQEARKLHDKGFRHCNELFLRRVQEKLELLL